MLANDISLSLTLCLFDQHCVSRCRVSPLYYSCVFGVSLTAVCVFARVGHLSAATDSPFSSGPSIYLDIRPAFTLEGAIDRMRMSFNEYFSPPQIPTSQKQQPQKIDTPQNITPGVSAQKVDTPQSIAAGVSMEKTKGGDASACPHISGQSASTLLDMSK